MYFYFVMMLITSLLDDVGDVERWKYEINIRLYRIEKTPTRKQAHTLLVVHPSVSDSAVRN
jgi:hypothetical protein